MLDFEIPTQINHVCDSIDTFNLIKEFLSSGEEHKNNSQFFINYDEEFQFIQYNFDRKIHLSLQELFQYSDEKISFESFINSIQERVKEQKNKYSKNEKFSKGLSIQNLDSQKIWLELDQKQKKVCNLYILNFIPKVDDGKDYQDIELYLNYLKEIRNHNKIPNQKKTKKDHLTKSFLLNNSINSSKDQNFPDKFFNFYNINQQMSSIYLGTQKNQNKYDSQQLKELQNQYETYIDKKIEYLKLIKNQKLSSLLQQLEEIIVKKNGYEANLQLIIIKLIQKHNLEEEFFLQIKHKKTQLYYFFKQYIRELIYKSIQQQEHQTFSFDQIVIYLCLLDFQKSEADVKNNIQQMIMYAHEKLVIFKEAWSGKILSDQEILQQFVKEQTEFIKSSKNKLINQDEFILNLLKSQIYKERVKILERGLNILKQHIKMEFSILAKEYFVIYEKYLQKKHHENVKEKEMMSKIFLKITKQQLNQINKQQN
ncbi:unnamed protein product [Paramecium sonneborni]|uniref:Uncharacterized protein n=1 Tax=Paramecium sonneborni TaxID=65129 RepID=A0A8S1M5A9_9CILI|nr:unnamed protein product [Paramecium sonneborni]